MARTSSLSRRAADLQKRRVDRTRREADHADPAPACRRHDAELLWRRQKTPFHAPKGSAFLRA